MICSKLDLKVLVDLDYKSYTCAVESVTTEFLIKTTTLEFQFCMSRSWGFPRVNTRKRPKTTSKENIWEIQQTPVQKFKPDTVEPITRLLFNCNFSLTCTVSISLGLTQLL